MVVSKTYGVYAVDHDSNLIDQVRSMSVTSGVQEIIEGGDGEVFNRFAAAGILNHSLSFETTGIANALGIADLDGVEIASDALLTAFFQKNLEGGTRAGASSHLKLLVNQGILVPRNISVQNGQAGSMNLEAICIYDGTNAPIVVSDSQSLSGSPATDEMFTVGPVVINDVIVEGIQSIDIDFGIQVISSGGDGEEYPTHAHIELIQPIIRFTTTDVAQLVAATMGLAGIKQDDTDDSLVYLRKVDEGGTRVANGTSEHVKFTIDQGRIYVDEAGGSRGDVAMATCVITPSYDGTNDPIVIAPATAIVLPS